MHNKLFNKYTINGEYKISMGFPGGAVVKKKKKKICLSMQEEAIDKDLITQSLGWKDPLEEEMAAQSRILDWRVPGERSLAGYSPQYLKDLDRTE